MHFRSGHALLVLLGVSFSVGFGTNSNNDKHGGSRLGLGLGLGVVVEAFAPSHSVSRGNRFANSCRHPPSSPTLNAEADPSSSSSSFASEGADADADAGPTGGGISMEAGGQLTKSEQQEPPSASSSDSAGSSAGASEYRPLQRQWWEGARAAEEAGPSSTGQGFFSTTTDRSRQSQGGITSSLSRYAPQKDVQRLQKRQSMQRIAASASVGNGRWHEGAGSSGVYGTQVIGGGRSTNIIGGFESDTDKARRERMEKQQMQAQEQAQRAADVAQLAASMKENEDADLNDNPEVAETIMADMSSKWEVPTPEEVENMEIDVGGLPEDMVDEEDGEEEVEAAEKSTGTVTGEWAVGADHKIKQSRRPPSGGRGFES